MSKEILIREYKQYCMKTSVAVISGNFARNFAKSTIIIHKTQKSKRDRNLNKLRYTQDDLEFSYILRDGYLNKSNRRRTCRLTADFPANRTNFETSRINDQTKWKHRAEYKRLVICDRRSVRKFATAVSGQPQIWQPPRFQALFSSSHHCVID